MVRLEAVFGVEVDVAGRACSCGVLLAHLVPALLHSWDWIVALVVHWHHSLSRWVDVDILSLLDTHVRTDEIAQKLLLGHVHFWLQPGVGSECGHL